MKNILIFALLLITGCAVTHTQLPIKKTLEPYCVKEDRNALWDTYNKYQGWLQTARRNHTEYCVFKKRDPYYATYYNDYCQNLEESLEKLDDYVKTLNKRYQKSCPDTTNKQGNKVIYIPVKEELE